MPGFGFNSGRDGQRQPQLAPVSKLNGDSRSNPVLGIDLGTTNSACAIWVDGTETIIANAHGDYLTPSVIAIDDDNTVLVGKSAKERLITHPKSSVACFKRFMGTNHNVSLGKRHQYTATELSAMVLRALKQDAENTLQCQIQHAVISVPAYFNDAQRQATQDAGELAGLTVNRLINEPTAAALAHGLHDENDRRFIVLDLGGGTFDVSILEYFDNILEVHATSGDSALGGEDFNDSILKAFLNKFDLEDEFNDPEKRQRLYVKVETCKRTIKASNTAALEAQVGDQNYVWKIDEAALRDIAAKLLLRLRTPMERAIRDAGITPREIDDVVLVGGATRMSVFRSLVSKLFGRLPRTDANPDLTIVSGAALQGALIARDKMLDDVVMTDVCPFSLGIAIAADRHRSLAQQRFSPIIERNSVVPVSRVENFFTIDHMQPHIAVRIYQGESRDLRNNLFLGSIDIPVAPKPAGEECVAVRFSYDVNGLLEVDVEVASTGQTFSKVIENRPGGLDEKEKRKSQKRLQSLKVLPRDREEVRAIRARAERLFASVLGEERNLLGELIDQYEVVLNGQNPHTIEKASDEFSNALDRFDQDIWQ